jgi:uncharacterized protein YhdP
MGSLESMLNLLLASCGSLFVLVVLVVGFVRFVLQPLIDAQFEWMSRPSRSRNGWEDNPDEPLWWLPK